MFQEKDDNCILNSESKETKPDLFTQEKENPVVYFQPNCAGSKAGGSSNFKLLSISRLKKSIIIENEIVFSVKFTKAETAGQTSSTSVSIAWCYRARRCPQANYQ